MDNRKFESGASASPPSPPASPSSGYPTNGNPATSTPATLPGEHWFHQIGEELRGVIVAAALTPSNTDLTQLTQAIQVLISAGGSLVHGQCRLAKSGANLLLSPMNGNKLIINGAVKTIPAAGVSLAPPATTNTVYYIYAYMVGSTMTLEYSTTGHATDSTTGVEIKSGDATRTLVGMARTVSNAWVDTPAQRFVISWFNRRKTVAVNTLGANASTTSASYAELNSTYRAEFLSWSSPIVGLAKAAAWFSLANNYILFAVAIDGSIQTAGQSEYFLPTGVMSSYTPMIAASPFDALGEGYHFAQMYAAATQTGGANTATYYATYTSVQAEFEG